MGFPLPCQLSEVGPTGGRSGGGAARSLGLSATDHKYFSIGTNTDTSNQSTQPAVLFFQNKPAPAISHQPTEHAACLGFARSTLTGPLRLCPLAAKTHANQPSNQPHANGDLAVVRLTDYTRASAPVNSFFFLKKLNSFFYFRWT
jgi:hypothetical protein